ncbi:hypothetical protein CRYUN_Cryun31cG0032800 [Craigia yunnanensis]
MAAYLILLPAFLTCLFFSLTSQDQQNNNHNLFIRELHDAKLKISRLESVIEERIQSINAKTLYLKEREKLFEDMEKKITYLQSALSSLKHDLLLADERLKALEEEVHLLWAVSRKNNFEFHVLESKVQDAEDRLEVVTSQVEKISEVVTEQWIQIQHLEQAFLAEMRALQAQRQRNMRWTFLKFISGLSVRNLPKMFGVLDSYSLGKGSVLKYMSQALQQLRRFYSATKKYHHEFFSDLSGRHLPKMFGSLDSYSLGKGSTVKYYMSQALQQLRRFYSATKKYHHEFISDLSGRHLPKMFGALDSYSLGKGSAIKYYISQALQQLRRFYSATKKYHHEFISDLSGRHLPKMFGALYSYSLEKGSAIIYYMSQALQQLRRFYSATKKYYHEFISDLSGRHLPKMFGSLDSYSLGKGSAIKYYMSQALQQLRRFYSATKKYHHEVCLIVIYGIFLT